MDTHKTALSLALLLVTLFAPDGFAQLTRHTLIHQGLTREYFVRLPSAYDGQRELPLIIAMHGGGGSARRFEAVTSDTLKSAADGKGIILVYPQGAGRAWSDGRQGRSFRGVNVNDVGFISRMLDDLKSEYRIDSSRVYATGISNGGFMAIYLAIQLSDRIAAVAPVTANVPRNLTNQRPANPVSVCFINGTSDPLVPYNGGEMIIRGKNRGYLLPTEDSVEFFAQFNGCSLQPQVRHFPDVNRNDDSTVEEFFYAGGRDGSEVILLRINEGGHTWPGGRQYFSKQRIGTVNRDFEASTYIINFFLRHSR